jgi:hypothetical protein
MNEEQKSLLITALRGFLIERNQHRDKIEALERVLQGSQELAPHYAHALAEVQRNPSPSVDIEPMIEALRRSLFPDPHA